MKMDYEFQGCDGAEYKVELTMIQEEAEVRPYGIRAEIFREGILKEKAEATRRFLTQGETEKAMELLRKFQVTPCTLSDVI